MKVRFRMGSMCPMSPQRRLPGFLIFTWALWLAVSSWGQQKPSYWRVYKMADGLPEPACTSVTLAPRAKILVRHPTRAFVSELDGYSVRTVPLGERSNRVWESPGDQLWTASSKGLVEYRDGNWLVHPVREITDHYGTNLLRNLEIPLYPVR